MSIHLDRKRFTVVAMTYWCPSPIVKVVTEWGVKDRKTGELLLRSDDKLVIRHVEYRLNERDCTVKFLNRRKKTA